jgi:hypothetical protein
MRPLWVLALLGSAVLAGASCGGGKSSEDFYKGDVTVSVTDNVRADGTFALQDIFNPNVKQVLALVELKDPKVGMDIRGDWYQLGVLGLKDPKLTPEGVKISSKSFKLTSAERGNEGSGAQLAFTPTSPLPEDAYMVKVYVDGKLAKVSPFVVSRLVPAAGQQPASAPTPPRTATPATAVPTSTPAR